MSKSLYYCYYYYYVSIVIVIMMHILVGVFLALRINVEEKCIRRFVMLWKIAFKIKIMTFLTNP